MSKSISTNTKTLEFIAQYRVLSSPQIVELENTNKRNIYRRIKTLSENILFFLEYDRGTEPLAGNHTPPNNVRWKIRNYQHYFQDFRYKQYEKIFACSLNGFRLLLVSNSNERHQNLCRLVKDNPPSDFVWGTTLDEILLHGLGGKIWVRGGNRVDPPESILGSEYVSQQKIQSNQYGFYICTVQKFLSFYLFSTCQ